MTDWKDELLNKLYEKVICDHKGIEFLKQQVSANDWTSFNQWINCDDVVLYDVGHFVIGVKSAEKYKESRKLSDILLSFTKEKMKAYMFPPEEIDDNDTFFIITVYIPGKLKSKEVKSYSKYYKINLKIK